MKADFSRDIPISVRKQIKKAISITKQTGKEQSLTFCRIRDRIYVSEHVSGETNETVVKPCSEVGAEQMGDLHTHPVQLNTTVGITPSTADIVSTLTDSVDHNIPQVSCIAGPGAKYISCYQPTVTAMKEKVNGYKDVLNQPEGKNVTDIHPFIRENVAQDFTHAWYSKKSFRRTIPTPEEVVKNALMKSEPFLRNKDIPENKKPEFCKLVEDLNFPMHGKVSKVCNKRLKK